MQIRILYLSGKYQEEENKANEYMLLEPENIEAIENLAMAYMHNSKYEQAYKEIEKALSKLNFSYLFHFALLHFSRYFVMQYKCSYLALVPRTFGGNRTHNCPLGGG